MTMLLRRGAGFARTGPRPEAENDTVRLGLFLHGGSRPARRSPVGRSSMGLYIVPRGTDTEGWVLVGFPTGFSDRTDCGDGMSMTANGESIGRIGDEPTGGVKYLSDGMTLQGRIAG